MVRPQAAGGKGASKVDNDQEHNVPSC